MVSLLGSAIPFVPLPYLAIVVLLSATQNPLLLGLVAGAGGALGKVTSYVLGRLGYLAAGDTTKRNLNVIHDISAKYGMLGVFVFSVTPLPDDIYVIPMGIVRLPFWKFFAANLAGKILLSVFVAYVGRTYFYVASLFLDGGSLPALVLVVAATVILSVVIARSDWILAVEIARTKGLRALAANLPKILRLTGTRKDRVQSTSG